MHPGIHAAEQPEKLAAIDSSTGASMTYAELEARSNRLAQLLRREGLQPGDHVALLLENTPRYLEAAWGAMRAGLYVTPINWHLGPGEAGYIIEDCDATALISSPAFSATLEEASDSLGALRLRLGLGGAFDDFDDLDLATESLPPTPIADESLGTWMFYSSGTTGRPKGILPPLTGAPLGTPTLFDDLLGGVYGFSSETVYLCPAPLYHAAPSGWSLAAVRMGGSVVIMDRFDAEEALAAIERYRVTHVQFVPTHLIRLLKLPAELRAAYDLSSLKMVVHAAAPCPVEVKRAIIDWFGPIVHEFYAGSEGNGFCAIGPEEWLAHPGSVGRCLTGTVHILGEEGEELGRGETGQIWFESQTRFEYHKDPEKTASSFDEHGWSSLGDIGYLDEEGYLYLTDRVSHMIISGGVNIYPREVEDVLVLHPAVRDVAVIGIPDAEMGEQVLAVVELDDPRAASEQLEVELLSLCRSQLAGYKCPRRVDFIDELPRLPTGKLLKRKLRDHYESEPPPARSLPS